MASDSLNQLFITANFLFPLCLSFPICKQIIVVPNSEGKSKQPEIEN